MFISNLGKDDIILGTDWLKYHDPSIRWRHREVHFDWCPQIANNHTGLPRQGKNCPRWAGCQTANVPNSETNHNSYLMPMKLFREYQKKLVSTIPREALASGLWPISKGNWRYNG